MERSTSSAPPSDTGGNDTCWTHRACCFAHPRLAMPRRSSALRGWAFRPSSIPRTWGATKQAAPAWHFRNSSPLPIKPFRKRDDAIGFKPWAAMPCSPNHYPFSGIAPRPAFNSYDPSQCPGETVIITVNFCFKSFSYRCFEVDPFLIPLRKQDGSVAGDRTSIPSFPAVMVRTLRAVDLLTNSSRRFGAGTWRRARRWLTGTSQCLARGQQYVSSPCDLPSHPREDSARRPCASPEERSLHAPARRVGRGVRA